MEGSSVAAVLKGKSMRLPKNILKIVFMFLECKQLIKDRFYALNKWIYQDVDWVKSMHSQLIMQKLGVINDITFELEYFQEVLGAQ
jgi:hypothetical protein